MGPPATDLPPVLSPREGCRILFGGPLLLAVLGLIWIAVLTPAVLRARSAHRQHPDFSDFYSSLSRIGQPSHLYQTHTDDPRERRRLQLTRRRTAERRRRVFNTLGGATLFAWVAAALGNSGTLWVCFAVGAVLLVAYVGLLISIARNARPRSLNVVYMGVPMTPQFATQRVVNS